jgi:hypothetical protein
MLIRKYTNYVSRKETFVMVIFSTMVFCNFAQRNSILSIVHAKYNNVLKLKTIANISFS